MPHFPKPAEGSWTEHYPELGTGPVSYEDSISPEFFELEREAIFARTWLNVGRVEQLPRVGSYFTREIDAARTSIVVVRAADGEVRAFHNMCRHRGNKLVWQDYPREETAGTCRQFHMQVPRVALLASKATCTFVQQEDEFFDLDKADYGLAPVQVDVWEGFIFVNLDADQHGRRCATTSARSPHGLEGYPFGEMTQVYKYRADVHSNWKLYIDAFAEFYHAPVLHAKQYVADESSKLMGYGFEGLHYALDGPHGMVSSWGGMAPPKDPSMVKPIERILRSGNFGAVGPPRHPRTRPAAARAQPGPQPHLGPRLVRVLPQLHGAGLGARAGTSPTTTGRSAYNRHIFEGTLYFVPAKTARDRMRQEMAAVTFKEFGLQDCNTLEATQTMLESRAVSQFPLGRPGDPPPPPHHTAGEYVAAYQAAATVIGDDRASAARRVRRPRTVRRLGAPHRTRALRQAARRARWTSCRRSTTPPSPASRTPRRISSNSPSTTCPTTPATSSSSATR